MGIVNVTPDSFFPGSRTARHDAAIARGRALFAAGCDIVDVGGESTRPGADAGRAWTRSSPRVVAVIAALCDVRAVSVDTQKEAVARAAVAAGAHVVNDVSCTLVEVAGELGVGLRGHAPPGRLADHAGRPDLRRRRRRGRRRS